MRLKGSFPASSLVAVVVGIMVAGIILALVPTIVGGGVSQTEIGRSVDKLGELEKQIEEVCTASNKQSSDSFRVESYDFSNVRSLSIESGSLIADLEKGGSERRALEEGCSYEWSGIETQNTLWEINVSADYSEGPKVTVEAEMQ